MNVSYYFYSIFSFLSKSREIWFSIVRHSSQHPESINTFTPNSSNQNYLSKKIWWFTFFSFYLWAKYESLWTDFTAQTVTLGAILLVKVQTIPQNAKCALFCLPDIWILNMAMVFEIWLFCNFQICENT